LILNFVINISARVVLAWSYNFLELKSEWFFRKVLLYQMHPTAGIYCDNVVPNEQGRKFTSELDFHRKV